MTRSKREKSTQIRAGWKRLAIVGILVLSAAPTDASANSTRGNFPPAAETVGTEFKSLAQIRDDISDDMLKSFKTAKSSLQAIKDAWQNRIDRGEVDPADDKAHDAVRTQMTSTIELNGLSVEEFNMIDDALQADRDLRERYKKIR